MKAGSTGSQGTGQICACGEDEGLLGWGAAAPKASVAALLCVCGGAAWPALPNSLVYELTPHRRYDGGDRAWHPLWNMYQLLF